MNTRVIRDTSVRRDQPLLAVALALAVHGLLAVLLLFGFRWQIPQPAPVQVELWAAPARASRPVTPRSEPARPTPPPRPAPAETLDDVPDADIRRQRPEKRPTPPAPEPRPSRTPPDKPPAKAPEKPAAKPAPDTSARPSPRYIPQPGIEDEVPTRSSSTSGTASTSRSGAQSAELLEVYLQSINELIRSRVTQPPGLAGNPVAEFRIVILAGMVIDDHPQLVRASGDAQWDAAAERAILLSRQLPPLPPGLAYGPELRSIRVKLCPKTCR